MGRLVQEMRRTTDALKVLGIEIGEPEGWQV